MPTLVTRAEAAKELHVSLGMIQHWIRKGLLEKHDKLRQLNGPRSEYMRGYLGEVCSTYYLVDLDVARLLVPQNAIEKLKEDNPAANLLTAREIAKLTNRRVETISMYVNKFGLKKYKLNPKSSHYLIDGEELADAMENAGLPLT
jgi:hypothetical protein